MLTDAVRTLQNQLKQNDGGPAQKVTIPQLPKTLVYWFRWFFLDLMDLKNDVTH